MAKEDQDLSKAQSSASRTSLTSQCFEEARERYLDETKPDPLIRRQIEGWTLQWLDDDGENDDAFAERSEKQPKPSPLKEEDDDDDLASSWKFTNVLSGRLRIHGDYMVVTLHTECWWRKNVGNDNNDNDTTTAGNAKTFSPADALWFQCRASAEFVALDQQQQHASTPTPNNNTTAAHHHKIHQQMVKRLSADDYIAKLLLFSDPSREAVPPLVFEAQIRVHHDQSWEERVQNHQDIAQGIRRAVFSRADNTLDVLELLVNLPYLPTSTTSSRKSNSPAGDRLALASVVKLADRAKLRLLEDFMCDACEFEGEDELVSELELGSTDEKQQPHKRVKRAL